MSKTHDIWEVNVTTRRDGDILEARGVHSLLYFAYTCVRDLFIGGGYLPCRKDYKVMIFYM
jgi:hypothetical protein